LLDGSSIDPRRLAEITLGDDSPSPVGTVLAYDLRRRAKPARAPRRKRERVPEGRRSV